MSAKKKLLEYLKYTSIVNPHARFRVELDEEAFTFDRVSHEIIACPVAIQPHPHGIEFGQLKRMAAASDQKLADFLVEGFSRVGKKVHRKCANRQGSRVQERLRHSLRMNSRRSSPQCRQLPFLHLSPHSASHPLVKN
jgi:DNA topoisomerase-6 subunit B